MLGECVLSVTLSLGDIPSHSPAASAHTGTRGREQASLGHAKTAGPVRDTGRYVCDVMRAGQQCARTGKGPGG